VTQPGCLHPPPHQEQPHPRGFDAGHRAQEELEVLLAVQAADVEEHAILGRESEGLADGPAVARPEAAEVDSGRQHLDGPAHALRPEPPRDEVRRGDHQVGGVGEPGAPANGAPDDQRPRQRHVMGIPVVERVVREDEGAAGLTRQTPGRGAEQERMVSVKHIEVERAQAPAERRAERQREREVGIRGGRQSRHADDPAPPIVGSGHPGRDDHRLVPERLEVSPEGLDGGGHAAEHREVVVREETDS
jgi:hypothetical protein